MELFTGVFGDLLQPILEALLTILVPAVLGLLAAWLKALRDKIYQEMDARGLSYLRDFAIVLVKAAEQAGFIGEIRDVGEAKKSMVIALLQAEADRVGIKIDVDKLSAIVEAAVVEVFGFSGPSEEETFSG